MAADTLRWSKFWWSDWQADQALRSCGVAARGLWMDMLCIANSGTPRGHVTINGVPVTPRRLAVLAGITEKECASLLQELREAGVFSETPDGVIYSRRMVRDTTIAEAGREAVGKRWGKRDTPTAVANTGANRVASTLEAKRQKLEAEAEDVPHPANAGCSSPPEPAETPALPFAEDPPEPILLRRPPAAATVPVQAAAEIWNEVCGPTLGTVLKLTDMRQRHLRARLAEHWSDAPLDGWRAYCARIMASDWLSGRRAPTSGPHANWRCSFDWAVTAANAVKVLEGNYDNQRRAPAPDPDRPRIAPGTI